MTQWGLDTLFNPAKQHMDEEKRRLQSTREEIGDSSGGERIDLESGKVTIRKRDAPQPAKAPKRKAARAAAEAERRSETKTPAQRRAAARKAAAAGAKGASGNAGTAAQPSTTNDGRARRRGKSAH